MKNLRKLVIASFMLVIAFVAVVSSTYAWFTRGTDATVNNIEIGVVDASKSLLIGREEGAWSKSVTVKPFGELTPVTLRSANINATNDAGLFQQLVWSDSLVPSFENVKALNEEYVKTSDIAVDANKTYYTLSVSGDDNRVTFTEVAQPTEDGLANYYEKPEATKMYIKATGEFNAQGTYYVLNADNNKYELVEEPDSDDFANYYVENPNYVAEGYIAFDLFFQITVDNADEWANTSIQMELNNLHAYDVQNSVVTNNENERALSSFRLAVAEGASANQSIARVVEGEGHGTGNAVLSGLYGSGDQFALTNGWLEMLRTSTINAENAVINKDESKFFLVDAYKDAVASDYYAETTNEDGKVKKIDAAAFEYVMACGDDAPAQIRVSGDGLTKTFQITVYVWTEGWDGDCINAAAGCMYYFGLSFRAN